MARKRMFTLSVVDSDAFLDMPLSAQALYFHLNMRADDDGFIGNPKRIKNLIGASEDDLKLLIAKRFVMTFEDGVIVIKHWRMHNTIQRDRYTPTVYQDEIKMLNVKANKSYTLEDDNKMFPKCFQNVSTGKGIDIGLDKDIDIDIYNIHSPEEKKSECDEIENKTDGLEAKIDNDRPKNPKKKSIPPQKVIPPSLEMVESYCLERGNGIDANEFIDFYASKGWLVGKVKMKDWQAAVRTWERSRGFKFENKTTPYTKKKPVKAEVEETIDLWNEE